MSDIEEKKLRSVQSLRAMVFGSAAGCFAAIISIVSANEVTLPLKIAFGLFVIAIPLLSTAGIICEFILSEDLNRARGEKFALRFTNPGYYFASAGLVALSAYLYWWLALIVAVLIVVGYVTIRYLL